MITSRCQNFAHFVLFNVFLTARISVNYREFGVSLPLGDVQRKSYQACSHQEPLGGSGMDRTLE